MSDSRTQQNEPRVVAPASEASMAPDHDGLTAADARPAPGARKLPESQPTDAARSDLFDTALRLEAQGEFEQALAVYETILAAQPRNTRALYQSCLCLLSLARPENAVARLRETIAIEPCAPLAHVMLGIALRRLGQLHEAIAGMDRAIEVDPRCFIAWIERGITQIALECPHDALSSFDKAIAIDPASLSAISHRGEALRLLDQIDQAMACYDHVLAVDPNHMNAILGRASTLSQARRNIEALQGIERALSIDSGNKHALNNRGNLLVALRHPGEALKSFEQALAIDPGFIAAWINMANALEALGRRTEAKAASDRAVALGPESPAARWNAALLDLRAGSYESGWERYQVRWLMNRFGTPRHRHLKLWLGHEDLRGKRIVLWQEQGLGDTIQFSRYAIMVAALGAAVVLEVQPALKRLMAESFKGMAYVIGSDERAPECDFATPLMSLPLAFATAEDTIPFAPRYLKTDPTRVQSWAARLGGLKGRLRIGLACTGNPKHKGDLERSIDLATLASLTEFGDLFIVQKDMRADDHATLAAHPEIVHFGEALTDFAETAALVDNLDLVITVDTSLAHLSGALGKPVWVLLPAVPDWRWQHDRTDSPWYPSARLFRQGIGEGWGHVVQRVREALEAFEAPARV
ncbi:tetratricopeptide repeat protein [Pararobbsia silviterrae]|uniref:Tetratricopeptide repeat protein n=1 Tax=Pararobbsia silviterrae TaxID=1792498 RepID=A0A494X8X3_9BURK|nr:tetratricopeptide repeat protein [Pararobbsia silviterrae]RKP47167.1 tetratricopeptide repeat protein [Pararobbsia silviterrae]